MKNGLKTLPMSPSPRALIQRDPGSWTLLDLMTLIRDHGKLLNVYYFGTPLAFEVTPEYDSATKRERIVLYVYTRYPSEPSGAADRIKEAFNAESVDYLPLDIEGEDDHPCWSIVLGWTTLPRAQSKKRSSPPLSASELADIKEGEQEIKSGKAPVFSTSEDWLAALHKKREASP